MMRLGAPVSVQWVNACAEEKRRDEEAVRLATDEVGSGDVCFGIGFFRILDVEV